MLVQVGKYIFYSLYQSNGSDIADVKGQEVYIIVCVQNVAIDCLIHISFYGNKTQVDGIGWVFIVVNVYPLVGLIDK